MFPKPIARDPRELAPVGAYLTDGTRLVYVLSSDAANAITECAVTSNLVVIGPIDLMQKWKRVRPARSL